MVQRLFQDPAGTIPAILPGQPVGLIKRLAGSVDASQATALSKGTLARWPKSGVRMLQSRNVFDSVPLGPQVTPNFVSGFGVSSSSDGINVDVLDRGYEGGEPFIIVRMHGTNTLGATKFLNIQNSDILSGNYPITVSAKIALLAGSLSNNDNGTSVKLYSSFRRGGLSVNGTAILANIGPDLQAYTANPIATDGIAVDQIASRGLYLRIPIGQTVDATIKIVALQVELGAVKTPFQTVYNPNDITEAGVPDLWHLYNDGGDSLNVVLPAGTYGFATLNAVTKTPQIDSVVSDGTAPINVLRHERQADEILRAGAFSDTEIRAIQEYWGREFG